MRIPIQSGSDKILKAMKRRYNKEEINDLLSKIREKMPDLKINTHFLVGFPGETYKDFMDTMHLTDYFYFHKIDVFCYQDRPGVESVNLPNKINKKLRFKRAHELASKGRNIDIVY
jgi:tRNA-2-methylthio-N6-dimethylallyladenosine synthase